MSLHPNFCIYEVLPWQADLDSELSRVIVNHPEMFDEGFPSSFLMDVDGNLLTSPEDGVSYSIYSGEQTSEYITYLEGEKPVCGICREAGTEKNGKNPVFALQARNGALLFAGCRRCFDVSTEDNPLARELFYSLASLRG